MRRDPAAPTAIDDVPTERLETHCPGCGARYTGATLHFGHECETNTNQENDNER